MRALLLVAHGSRREASNEEVRTITRLLRSRAEPEFALVHCAFLELADPLIPEGLEQCRQAGAAEVVVLPYFLSAGRHVTEDIPGIVSKYREIHPELVIRLAPHLGTATGLPDALFDLAKI